MDIKEIGKAIAKLGLPLLGTALGGPGGLAIGSALAQAIGSGSGEPAAILAHLGRDADAIEKARQFELTHKEILLRIGLEETKVYAEDTQDARAKHAQNKSVFWMGVAILLSFVSIAGLSMLGSYLILSGGIIIKDVGIVAAVFGFLGTVVGYMAANAQQVVGYFYGSSKGSSEKTDAMAKSFQQIGQKVS